MTNFSFNEFQKDMERIQKMGDLPKSNSQKLGKKHGFPPPETPPPIRRRKIEWGQIWLFVKSLFHWSPAPSSFQPSDEMVRLLQVLAAEPRTYHLFMFLATSPLENRRAMLQKLESQIQAETHDPQFISLVKQLQDPRIFEAAYRTIQDLKGERKKSKVRQVPQGS